MFSWVFLVFLSYIGTLSVRYDSGTLMHKQSTPHGIVKCQEAPLGHPGLLECVPLWLVRPHWLEPRRRVAILTQAFSSELLPIPASEFKPVRREEAEQFQVQLERQGHRGDSLQEQGSHQETFKSSRLPSGLHRWNKRSTWERIDRFLKILSHHLKGSQFPLPLAGFFCGICSHSATVR